jgi:hypothetical protein
MRLLSAVVTSIGFAVPVVASNDVPSNSGADKAPLGLVGNNPAPQSLGPEELNVILTATMRQGLDVKDAAIFSPAHPILTAKATLPKKPGYRLDTLLPYRETSFDKQTLSINPGALQHASLLTAEGPQFLLHYTNKTVEGPSWYAYATSQYRITQTTLIPNPKNPGAYVAVMQLTPEGEQPKPDADGYLSRATPTPAMDAVAKKTGGEVWSYFNSLVAYQSGFRFDHSQPPEIMNDLVTIGDDPNNLTIEVAYPKDFRRMLRSLPRDTFGNGVVISNINFHAIAIGGKQTQIAIADAQPVASAKDSLALQLRQAFSYTATYEGALTVNIGEQQVSEHDLGESGMGVFSITPKDVKRQGPDLQRLLQAKGTKTIGAR